MHIHGSVLIRNERIGDYLFLARPIAKQFSCKSGCDCVGLIQVSCLGLIQESDRFNQPKQARSLFSQDSHSRCYFALFKRQFGFSSIAVANEERALKLRDKIEQIISPDNQATI